MNKIIFLFIDQILDGQTFKVLKTLKVSAKIFGVVPTKRLPYTDYYQNLSLGGEL